MKKSIYEAQKKGLNWQALIIEDAQAAILSIIKTDTQLLKSPLETRKKVIKIIEQTVSQITTTSLKRRVEATLKDYARKIYWYYSLIPQRIALICMYITSNKKTPLRSKEKALETLRSHYPVEINKIAPKGIPYIEIAQPLNTWIVNYMKQVIERIDKIGAILPKDPNYGTTLRAVAEMEVRREQHEKELANLKANGIRLVWISSHANCSDRCAPWQGRLYSLDGSVGRIDGIDYVPLENATDIFVTTKAGVTYKNGCISGFGCRHRLIPYVKGNRPVEVPSEIILKQRKLEARQRALERTVQKYRYLAIAHDGVTNESIKYKRLAIAANNRYKAFCKENDLAYYPDRTKIFEQEI